MRRSLAALLVLASVSLTACGQSSTKSSSTASTRASSKLTVTPSSGRPNTVFTIRFVAPAASSPSGKSTISYTIGITGPGGGRCVGTRSIPVPLAAKGETVSIALGPATLGGDWCAGTYHARALETQRPVCASGSACPQYVRVVAVFGPTTFRVATA